MGDKTQNKDVAAGLDIPVKAWEDARNLINCIITSAASAKILQDELGIALSADPVPFARVNEIEARLFRRRETHRLLLTQLNDIFMTLAGHLERAGT